MQLVIIALITMTVFIRTRMKVDMEHANYYMSSLFYALIRLMCNGIAELALTVSRLGVFYKQRDFYFYPAWACSIPAALLKVPFSMLDAFMWTALTYYVIGYSPEPERWVLQETKRFLHVQEILKICRLIVPSSNCYRYFPGFSVSFFFFSLYIKWQYRSSVWLLL